MAYRKQTDAERRISILRSANTRATTRLTVSGRKRGEFQGDTAPRPVTLVKMPWDDEKEQKR